MPLPERVRDDPVPVQVQNAVRTWTDQLYDLSGRNSLLFSRELKVGTLNLNTAEPAALRRLLEGRTVSLKSLFPESDGFAPAAKSAKAIYGKVKEYQEERGIDIGYLAVGTVTWETVKDTTPNAPLVLRGVAFVEPPTRSGDCKLRLDEFSDVNPALLRALNTEHNCTLQAEDFADLLADGGEPREQAIADRLRDLAGSRAGIAIGERLLLGTFSFAKLPMVRDLEQAGHLLADSVMVGAICGDAEAQRQIHGDVLEAGTTHSKRAADEFLVFDSDSSQTHAIDAIVDGANLVIDGPPGTGKSQTIANLIATLSARGKKVLFVAEKRAAIDAVLSRIGNVGLSSLVMDIHSGATDRRAIAAELGAALQNARTAPVPDLDRLHRGLDDERAQLDEHAAAMHRPREPWGISLYEVQAALLSLSDAESAFRLAPQALSQLAGTALDQIREQLRRYTDLGGFEHARQGPWLAAAIRTTEDLGTALDALGSLHANLLDAANETMTKVRYQTRFQEPEDIDNWSNALDLLHEVARTLETFKPEMYEADLDALAAACGTRRWRKRKGVELSFGARRTLVRQARALARMKLDNATLHTELLAAAGQRRDWRAWQTEPAPVAIPDGLPEAAATFEAFKGALAQLAPFITSVRLPELRIDLLRQALAGLAADTETPYRLVELHRLRDGLAAAGCQELLRALVDCGLSGDAVLRRFDYGWHQSIRDHVRRHDPVYGAFSGTDMDATVRAFQEHDTDHIRANAARVRRISAERFYNARNSPRLTQQETFLKAQAGRKRSPKPIRDLLSGAGELLLELKPVWAMSPLVVSQVLPQKRMFDVVIFDEASQIPIADAIPSIMRAEQTVVAGDPRQLPPTNFFGSMEHLDDESDEDLSVASGYESILDALQPIMQRRSLSWHYRSRNERLIAFSNAWIYERSLTTFPGASEDDAVAHVLADGAAVPGDERSSSAEVNRVVGLIAEHAANRPHETLGVITMGITHANRIDAALLKARDLDPVLDGFLGMDGEEPFFVKNLERVQGDERDAIILSLGYGKGASGRVSHNFGPVNKEGGERRLNVAVTRAKRRMTLVSSFTYRDLDPEKLTKEGPKLMRAYLEFAESGGRALGAAHDEHPRLNPFEIAVRDRLAAAGIPLTPQYGAAGYRIDFAAGHPERPGQMVLAIEADGATYHSSVSARDRDRLRQQQLERLGWKFHRIWSTDWFRDPEEQVRLTREAYFKAVREADEEAEASASKTPVFKAPKAPDPIPESEPQRTVKPRIHRGASITDYSKAQLVQIVRWVLSDDLLRTDEELLKEVANEMGYKRVGARIKDQLTAAIRTARR